MNIEKWLKDNTDSLRGKWVAISGTTGGLGAELVRFVAELGGNIVFLNRSEEKTNKQRLELLNEFPNAHTKFIKVDMADINSVLSALEELKKVPLYAIIHNAGAYSIKRCKTSIGYDNLFTINFVSPYLLTKSLLPILREHSGRVVVVGSIAHRYSKTDPKNIDFGDVKANSLAYGNAKRYLMFSHFELLKEEKKVSLSVTHPGITFTGITNHYPKLIFAIIKHPMKIIFERPKRAALSVLKGLFDSTEHYFWLGPKLFNIWGLPSKKRLKGVDENESRFIFSTAENIHKEIKEAFYERAK